MQTKQTQEGAKKLTAEELSAKQLAEWVETEASFSRQCAEIVKILDKQLSLKPPLLNPADKKLFTKAREYYQEIAANPYPWFEGNITPDAIKQMPFDEQEKLYNQLYNFQDKINPSAQTSIINSRIEAMQWLTIHYDAMSEIVKNEKKFPLALNKENETPYLTVITDNAFKPGEKMVENLSEQEVAFQYLITPIQRLPRLPLLMRDLISKLPESYKIDQEKELTKLQEKLDEKGLESNTLIALSEINKKILNITKQFIADKKVPYITPLVQTEIEKSKDLHTNSRSTEAAIKNSIRKDEPAKNRVELKGKAKLIKKQIKAIDSVLEKKAKAINAISTGELELFSVANPIKSTSAFLKNEELVKLTANIRHHHKEITLLFDEKKYRDINNLIKARSAISDKTFALFIDPNLKTTLASLSRDNLAKLTIDVRLHQKEITLLFGKKAYADIHNKLQQANDPDIKKAFSTISDRELALCNAQNPQSFLQYLATKNLTDFSDNVDVYQKDLINLTADVYVHQKEINLLFGGSILPNTLPNILQALKKNNDLKITKAFEKLLPNDNLIHLFRGEERLKATFNSLKTPEALGELNLAVRSHRQELIFLFGKDAYQEISKAFAKEYSQSCLKANQEALDTLAAQKTFTSSDEQEHKKLLDNGVSLINLINQKEYNSLSHQEIDKLSNEEITLFTAPNPTPTTPILEKYTIEDLVKLTTDIRAHQKEIKLIFGEQAYKDMGKAFVEQYKNRKDNLMNDNKDGHHERWGIGYTHKEKADAVDKLLKAIDGGPKLEKETIKILEQGRLGKIAKPLMETMPKEQLKVQESSPKPIGGPRTQP